MNNSLAESIEMHPFFKSMRPEHLKLITECAAESFVAAGTVIFREGEPAGSFYLLEDGQVHMEVHSAGDGTAHVQTLGPGEVFGWSWLFPPYVWHLQATATAPTKLIVINGARLLIAAADDHEFGFELMSRVSQVLIHRLQSTRKQLLQLQLESAMDG